MHTPSACTARAAGTHARRALPLAFLGAVLPHPMNALGAERDVELRFAGDFDGRPFDCTETYAAVGSADTAVAVTDYRLYVSNLSLTTADGESVPVTLTPDDVWQTDDVALLDFENGAGRCDNGTGETNATVRGRVPDGDYTGVAFDLGVPFAENHGDPTLQGSPLNLTSMFWNWQGGYRFLKLDTAPAMAMSTPDGGGAHGDASAMEGHGDAAGMEGHGAAAGAWMLHVGSAGCASASRTSAPASASDCAAPNRARVELDGFDLAADVVVVDPAAVLREADLGSNAPDTAPGCMSATDDPDCATVMPLLGLPWDGSDAPAEQRLFSVRRDAP